MHKAYLITLGVTGLLAMVLGHRLWRQVAPPRAPSQPPWHNVQADAARLVRQLEFQEFQVVVEPPFVLVSDLPRPQVEHWVREIIRPARFHWQQLGLTKSPSATIQIWLLRDRLSYEKQSRRRFGEPPGTRFGYYLPRRQVIVVNGETGAGTLLHELSHPLLAANLPHCPPWLNEGFACLWEATDIQGHRLSVRPTRRLAILHDAIRRGTTRPLPQFCQATQDELIADHSGVLYAQAWYLCYFLHQRGRLPELLNAVRHESAADPTGYHTLCRLLDRPNLEPDPESTRATWQWDAARLTEISIGPVAGKGIE